MNEIEVNRLHTATEGSELESDVCVRSGVEPGADGVEQCAELRADLDGRGDGSVQRE